MGKVSRLSALRRTSEHIGLVCLGFSLWVTDALWPAVSCFVVRAAHRLCVEASCSGLRRVASSQLSKPVWCVLYQGGVGYPLTMALFALRKGRGLVDPRSWGATSWNLDSATPKLGVVPRIPDLLIFASTFRLQRESSFLLAKLQSFFPTPDLVKMCFFWLERDLRWLARLSGQLGVKVGLSSCWVTPSVVWTGTEGPRMRLGVCSGSGVYSASIWWLLPKAVSRTHHGLGDLSRVVWWHWGPWF